MKKISLALLLGLVQLSCQENGVLQSNEWRGGGVPPQAPANVQFVPTKMSVGKQQIEFSQQTWKDVPLEGTYFKQINGLSESKGTEFVSWQILDRIGMNLKSDIFWMKRKGKEAAALSQFQKIGSDLELGHMIQGPQLLIRTSPQVVAVWRGIFENKEGKLTSVDLNRKLDVVHQELVGSKMSDVTATLFPQGPLKSALQTVTLRDLQGNRSLSSDLVHISTRSSQEAVAENNQFLFPVEDQRFHQVQVYFYISQTLKWFENHLHFVLPFQLEAETALGFPEKTNTAFYFEKKIRLGEGDDEVFSRIPLDPTVVSHETVHAVVQAVARLPYQGEGGSLNEAFSDYFTTAQFKNPHLGEASYKKGPYKRTVINKFKFSEVNGGLYHDSGIFSGLLWELRGELGEDVANRLAWGVLIRLTPASQFSNFKTEFYDLLSKESPEIQKKAHLVLKERGWEE